jgi:hypothetical protein
MEEAGLVTQRLGMIARADNGGLGHLTWEFARHMKPDRVLIMDLGHHGRSDVHLERYAEFEIRHVVGWAPSWEDRQWLLTGSDVVYSAETWYADDEFYREAQAAGVRTYLHVMPELYRPNRLATELWVPTTWRREAVAGARLVPVPVATDRFEAKLRPKALHFVNVWAPAMLDRNGTLCLLAALTHIRSEIRVTIKGAQQPVHLPPGGPVTLDCVPSGYPDNYWDVVPGDADVLVMPRRYAGLCMPVQEAAARGMSAIMPAVSPQDGWPHVQQIGVRGFTRAAMPAGQVEVYEPDPIDLARKMDALAEDSLRQAYLSSRALDWAAGLSWATWAPRYRRLMHLDG